MHTDQDEFVIDLVALAVRGMGHTIISQGARGFRSTLGDMSMEGRPKTSALHVADSTRLLLLEDAARLLWGWGVRGCDSDAAGPLRAPTPTEFARERPEWALKVEELCGFLTRAGVRGFVFEPEDTAPEPEEDTALEA